MSDTISIDVRTRSRAVVTKPLVLIDWGHSGDVVYLSSGFQVTFNNTLYVPGDVSVTGITDGNEATLEAPATDERRQEILNDLYRNGVCKIYLISGLPDDDGVYEIEDAVLRLDGIITSSGFSGDRIRCRAVQTNTTGKISPRNLISEVANHIPASGSVFEWETKKTSLERKR